jgi:hypothetical protein
MEWARCVVILKARNHWQTDQEAAGKLQQIGYEVYTYGGMPFEEDWQIYRSFELTPDRRSAVIHCA